MDRIRRAFGISHERDQEVRLVRGRAMVLLPCPHLGDDAMLLILTTRALYTNPKFLAPLSKPLFVASRGGPREVQ